MVYEQNTLMIRPASGHLKLVLEGLKVKLSF